MLTHFHVSATGASKHEPKLLGGSRHADITIPTSDAALGFDIILFDRYGLHSPASFSLSPDDNAHARVGNSKNLNGFTVLTITSGLSEADLTQISQDTPALIQLIKSYRREQTRNSVAHIASDFEKALTHVLSGFMRNHEPLNPPFWPNANAVPSNDIAGAVVVLSTTSEKCVTSQITPSGYTTLQETVLETVLARQVPLYAFITIEGTEVLILATSDPLHEVVNTVQQTESSVSSPCAQAAVIGAKALKTMRNQHERAALYFSEPQAEIHSLCA